MTPRIHLVDASPYIFRAFFSLPPSLKSAAGLPANATYGFAGFLLKLLADEGVSHLALAFDESLTTSFRNDFYPEYKAQRELPDPDLERQLKGCVALAEALGIATFASPRYEAEDLLATVGAPLVEAGASAVIVSSDKDLMQLVTERVELFDFARGERYGPAEVVAKFGVRPGQIADYLGLAGDSVDNIPGVPGVGKKTASALLASFDSLEDLYSRLDEVPQLPIRGAKSLARKLAEHRGAAELSKRLATIVTDAETAEGVAKADLDRLELRRPDPALLEPWLEEHGFGSLAERLRVWPEAG